MSSERLLIDEEEGDCRADETPSEASVCNSAVLEKVSRPKCSLLSAIDRSSAQVRLSFPNEVKPTRFGGIVTLLTWLLVVVISLSNIGVFLSGTRVSREGHPVTFCVQCASPQGRFVDLPVAELVVSVSLPVDPTLNDQRLFPIKRISVADGLGLFHNHSSSLSFPPLVHQEIEPIHITDSFRQEFCQDFFGVPDERETDRIVNVIFAPDAVEAAMDYQMVYGAVGYCDTDECTGIDMSVLPKSFWSTLPYIFQNAVPKLFEGEVPAKTVACVRSGPLEMNNPINTNDTEHQFIVRTYAANLTLDIKSLVRPSKGHWGVSGTLVAPLMGEDMHSNAEPIVELCTEDGACFVVSLSRMGSSDQFQLDFPSIEIPRLFGVAGGCTPDASSSCSSLWPHYCGWGLQRAICALCDGPYFLINTDLVSVFPDYAIDGDGNCVPADDPSAWMFPPTAVTFSVAVSTETVGWMPYFHGLVLPNYMALASADLSLCTLCVLGVDYYWLMSTYGNGELSKIEHNCLYTSTGPHFLVGTSLLVDESTFSAYWTYRFWIPFPPNFEPLRDFSYDFDITIEHMGFANAKLTSQGVVDLFVNYFHNSTATSFFSTGTFVQQLGFVLLELQIQGLFELYPIEYPRDILRPDLYPEIREMNLCGNLITLWSKPSDHLREFDGHVFIGTYNRTHLEDLAVIPIKSANFLSDTVFSFVQATSSSFQPWTRLLNETDLLVNCSGTVGRTFDTYEQRFGAVTAKFEVLWLSDCPVDPSQDMRMSVTVDGKPTFLVGSDNATFIGDQHCWNVTFWAKNVVSTVNGTVFLVPRLFLAVESRFGFNMKSLSNAGKLPPTSSYAESLHTVQSLTGKPQLPEFTVSYFSVPLPPTSFTFLDLCPSISIPQNPKVDAGKSLYASESVNCSSDFESVNVQVAIPVTHFANESLFLSSMRQSVSLSFDFAHNQSTRESAASLRRDIPLGNTGYFFGPKNTDATPLVPDLFASGDPFEVTVDVALRPNCSATAAMIADLFPPRGLCALLPVFCWFFPQIQGWRQSPMDSICSYLSRTVSVSFPSQILTPGKHHTYSLVVGAHPSCSVGLLGGWDIEDFGLSLSASPVVVTDDVGGYTSNLHLIVQYDLEGSVQELNMASLSLSGLIAALGGVTVYLSLGPAIVKFRAQAANARMRRKAKVEADSADDTLLDESELNSVL